MNRSIGRAIVLAAALVGVLPVFARAQQMRRAAPPGGDSARPPTGPMRARVPYVGAWQGSITMRGDVPNAGRPEPIGMIFELADSTKRQYSGATIFGGNARSPHLKTVLADRELTWEEKNSGAGFFVYSARLVTPDSIVGTVTLRGGFQPEPSGTFVLVRRSP